MTTFPNFVSELENDNPLLLSEICIASQIAQSLHFVTMFRSSTVAETFNRIKCRLRIAQIISSLQDIKDYIREKNLKALAAGATTPRSTEGNDSNTKIEDMPIKSTDTTTTLNKEVLPPHSPSSNQVVDEDKMREIIQKYREHWCFLTVHDTQKIVFATLQAYLDADDMGGSAFYKALCVPDLVNLLFRLFFDPTMISYSFSLLIKMMQVDFSLLPIGILIFFF